MTRGFTIFCSHGCVSHSREALRSDVKRIYGERSPIQPRTRPVADFLCGHGDDQSGIFVYEQRGVLAAVEVYGLAGDAPKTLPTRDMIHAFSDATRNG
jgi:hypothetical protein